MQQARSCGHPDSSRRLHQLAGSTPNPNLGRGTARSTARPSLCHHRDKRDLLGLKLYEGTKIITVRDFLTLNRRLP
jgi:hypothetical protein